MNRLLATTALLALATAIILPASGAAPAAPKPSATPDGADALLRLDGPDHATAEIRQTWQGANAKGMRQSLNAIFGNKDDTLTQAEIDAISGAVARDMQGRASPFLAWDGQPAMVGNATVGFENAQGATTSDDPLTMTHALDVELVPGQGPQHTLGLSPLWNATLRVEWGEAWAANVEGALEPPRMEPNAFTAKVGRGAPINVTFSPAPPDAAAPAGAPQAQDATDAAAEPPANMPQKRKVPGVGAWGAGLALVGSAALLARRVRRER